MTDTISAEDYQELIKAEKKKRPKYNNTKVEYDGHTFDSIREMEHYKELKLREAAGEIDDLELQKKMPLYGPNGAKICEYWPDFVFYDRIENQTVFEDVKSEATRRDKVYRIKKKLFEDNYQTKLREV